MTVTGLRKLAIGVATFATALLATPAAADAASHVSRSGSTITITGDPDPNAVTLSTCCGGQVRVEDTSGATSDGSCTTLSPILVECNGTPNVTAALGDGGDSWGHPGGDLSEGLVAVTIDAGGGDDVIVGTSSQLADTITGGAGNDSLNGNGGNDTIRGGDGNDAILGGSENDQVFGDAGDDTVRGERNDDLVDGGAGTDTLNGDTAAATTGDGNDRIAARDGQQDLVSCGFGGDVVTADGVDVVDGSDCETVDRAPGGTGNDDGDDPPPPSSTGVDLLDPAAKVKISKLLRDGLTFEVSFGESARAELLLYVEKKRAQDLGLSKKNAVLAAISQDVEAGTYEATLTVREKYRSKLAKLNKVPAILGVVATGPSGESSDATKVTLKG